MTAPKLTPWYPPKVKPVRPGVYEVDYYDGIPWFRRWDGRHWHHGAGTVELAAVRDEIYTRWWQDPWRGLSAPEA